jgi:hypothetical protein
LPSFCFHTASNASGKKVESDISVVLFENEEAAVDYAKEKVEKKVPVLLWEATIFEPPPPEPPKNLSHFESFFSNK